MDVGGEGQTPAGSILATTHLVGALLAGGLGLAWLLSLVACLGLDLAGLNPALVLVAIVVRTFLHTGLFIIGHDAMHQVLVPSRPALNHRIGAIALGLYAALPYGICRQNHHLHHQSPGGDQDPDVHGNRSAPVWIWYARFMTGYLSYGQFASLLAGWGVVALGARWWLATPMANVLLFCTLPLLLSSLQLFFVGTYLPHRNQAPASNLHQAISLDWPEWLSLLACYHFGYHLEHHEDPQLCWFELPMARRSNRHLHHHLHRDSRPTPTPLIFAR
jgi:beta-carotene ketolase (CrtW type)